MKNDRDLMRRIQRARVVVVRFGTVVEAGLSREWTETVTDEPEWLALRDPLSTMRDESSAVSIESISNLLECIGSLLDLWDEEPMGSTYYPYKSAELIELHCRMVTRDLPDNAPVGLDEWLGRFARHVDWQMTKSGIELEVPQYFTALEESLKAKERQLNGANEAAFHTAMAASREAAPRYVDALRSALTDSRGPR
ncbi:hypothetical protein [Streptomyces gibsoniae]|uniref:Uncharacterized protein n=1 Tax=Streptomyces gibsoniae TaxID=3075529 RepID=A0ABU2U978_9ACTN|nr:hypothetical protein [Streptomyces sp. DSM 41699]MDT0469630.1 hypothetical protein [Streptomyces sp. DSM 41699]